MLHIVMAFYLTGSNMDHRAESLTIGPKVMSLYYCMWQMRTTVWHLIWEFNEITIYQVNRQGNAEIAEKKHCQQS